ncbi:MAG: pentapeptide repeat-containing protein, partial [Waterburya sp.]
FKLFVIAQVWKKKEKTRQEKLFCKQTDLLGANLRGANLQKADLRGAKLIGTNLIYTQFIDKNSNEENQASINKETSLTYALYAPNNGTKFPLNFNPDDQCMIAIEPGLNLPDFLKKNCTEQETVLRTTIFAKHFAKEKPSREETVFSKVAPFKETDLSRSDLQGAILSPNVDFSRTNLAKANLAEANLAEANLAEANLTQANLAEANLTQANLAEANLAEANLAEANLTQANLAEANLALAEANLAEVINLTPSQIKSACNWQKAFYKAEYNEQEKRWVTLEAENKKFIEKLDRDKSSDPEQPVDCSKWN